MGGGPQPDAAVAAPVPDASIMIWSVHYQRGVVHVASSVIASPSTGPHQATKCGAVADPRRDGGCMGGGNA